MADQDLKDDAAVDTVLMEIYAKVAVVRSQQTEINRRLGVMEKNLVDNDQRIVVADLLSRIEDLEDRLEAATTGKTKWWDWFWQAVMWVIGTSIAVAVAASLGVEVKA